MTFSDSLGVLVCWREGQRARERKGSLRSLYNQKRTESFLLISVSQPNQRRSFSSVSSHPVPEGESLSVVRGHTLRVAMTPVNAICPWAHISRGKCDAFFSIRKKRFHFTNDHGLFFFNHIIFLYNFMHSEFALVQCRCCISVCVNQMKCVRVCICVHVRLCVWVGR